MDFAAIPITARTCLHGGEFRGLGCDVSLHRLEAEPSHRRCRPCACDNARWVMDHWIRQFRRRSCGSGNHLHFLGLVSNWMICPIVFNMGCGPLDCTVDNYWGGLVEQATISKSRGVARGMVGAAAAQAPPSASLPQVKKSLDHYHTKL